MSDPYVAVCGEVLPTLYEGLQHEEYCEECNPDLSQDDYREDDIEND